MSEYTRRALRAVVAAAAMATIGMSLIGTAAAAPHSGNNNIGSPSSSSSDDNQSTSANSDDRSDTGAPSMPLDTNKGTPTPGVHNKLMNVEVPKVTTASYHTSWGTFAAEDSDDQSDADNPPADSMLSHNPQGDLSQTGDTPSTDALLGGLGGASKAPAPTSNLNQMNSYQVGTSKI